MSSKYDVPLPSPVGALIAFYEGSSYGLSDEQQMTLTALYNLHHAEAALARVEATCDDLATGENNIGPLFGAGLASAAAAVRAAMEGDGNGQD